MDRLVALDGKDVEACSHEQVVDLFRQSDDQCMFVVDKDTDHMCALVSHFPIIVLFLENRLGKNMLMSLTGESVSDGFLGGHA